MDKNQEYKEGSGKSEGPKRRDSRPADGERRTYSKGPRPAGGERRSYGNSPRPADGERRTYSRGPRPADGERPSYGNSPRPADGERRSYGNSPRPADGERRSYSKGPRPADGERRSYGSSPRPADGERRSYGSSPRPADGERRSYGSRPRPADGERRTYSKGPRPADGERPTYNKGPRPADGERRSYGKSPRPADGERRTYNKSPRPADGERRTYNKSPRPADGERRSFFDDKRPQTNKPGDREYPVRRDFTPDPQSSVALPDEQNTRPAPLPVPDLPIPQILEEGAGLPDRLEGRNPIQEAIKAGRAINKIWVAKREERPDPSLSRLIAQAKDAGAVVMEVEKRVLDAMSTTHSHQGIIAQVAAHEYIELDDLISNIKARDEAPFILILAELQESYNLGSILRIADAAGVQGVIIPMRRSVGLDAAVAKASAGAIEHVPVARVGNLTQTILTLKEQGFWIAGTDADGKTDYRNADWSGPLAILIGSEGEGLSPVMRRHCDYLISIPMFGKVNSLNAAVAAGIVTFEAAARRHSGQSAVRPSAVSADTSGADSEA